MDIRILHAIMEEVDLVYQNEDYFIDIFHDDDNVMMIENFAFSDKGLQYHICTHNYEHKICSIDWDAYYQFKELLNV